MTERNSYQEEVGRFVTHIQGTGESQLKKFHEESSEMLAEPLGSLEQATEATDTIITLLGIIHCAGEDFSELFAKKMKEAWKKYV